MNTNLPPASAPPPRDAKIAEKLSWMLDRCGQALRDLPESPQAPRGVLPTAVAREDALALSRKVRRGWLTLAAQTQTRAWTAAGRNDLLAAQACANDLHDWSANETWNSQADQLEKEALEGAVAAARQATEHVRHRLIAGYEEHARELVTLAGQEQDKPAVRALFLAQAKAQWDRLQLIAVDDSTKDRAIRELEALDKLLADCNRTLLADLEKLADTPKPDLPTELEKPESDGELKPSQVAPAPDRQEESVSAEEPKPAEAADKPSEAPTRGEAPEPTLPAAGMERPGVPAPEPDPYALLGTASDSLMPWPKRLSAIDQALKLAPNDPYVKTQAANLVKQAEEANTAKAERLAAGTDTPPIQSPEGATVTEGAIPAGGGPVVPFTPAVPESPAAASDRIVALLKEAAGIGAWSGIVDTWREIVRLDNNGVGNPQMLDLKRLQQTVAALKELRSKSRDQTQGQKPASSLQSPPELDAMVAHLELDAMIARYEYSLMTAPKKQHQAAEKGGSKKPAKGDQP
jgi:hypothetical protein